MQRSRRAHRLNSPASAGSACSSEIDLRTATVPTIAWIELTSRCPFDCVFCSRKLLRGNGMHMDFALYTRLIESLSEPEIIRLNYSGESVHYPHLVEAVRLAAKTGAAVELVTVLAALPAHKVEALAHSGLSQLTVSVHTLDPAQFRQIYRFGELSGLCERLEKMIALAPTAPRPLNIDLAFVAMQRNLAQLPAVVAYAASLGLAKVAVHPVIRRDPIEERFAEELDGDRLRPAFAEQIGTLVQELRAQYPQMAIELSTPEVAGTGASADSIDANPRYFPGLLPATARIAGCDQDPWQTMHVLADGRVVSCEERDQLPLGDLRTHSLVQIWHSPEYRQFRRLHLLGQDPHCRRCPYKQVYKPEPAPRRVIPGHVGMAALVSGWHPEAGAAQAWSKRRALLRVSAQAGELISAKLALPAAEGGNSVKLSIDGAESNTASNEGAQDAEVNITLRAPSSGELSIALEVARCFRPCERAMSPDQRELGAALLELTVGTDP